LSNFRTGVIIRLLGLEALGPVDPPLLGVDDHGHPRERRHDLGRRAELGTIAAGPVEGESAQGIEDHQDGADVELGVPLVEPEEESEDLVRRSADLILPENLRLLA
jgi:hypothetical protein